MTTHLLLIPFNNHHSRPAIQVEFFGGYMLENQRLRKEKTVRNTTIHQGCGYGICLDPHRHRRRQLLGWIDSNYLQVLSHHFTCHLDTQTHTLLDSPFYTLSHHTRIPLTT